MTMTLKRLSGSTGARSATLRFIPKFDEVIEKCRTHPHQKLDDATKDGLADNIPRFIDNASSHMFDSFKRIITSQYQPRFELKTLIYKAEKNYWTLHGKKAQFERLGIARTLAGLYYIFDLYGKNRKHQDGESREPRAGRRSNEYTTLKLGIDRRTGLH